MNESSGQKKPTICVTGAGGFVGTHVTRELLKRGYRVHATVRDANAVDATAHLRRFCPEASGRLRLYSADLMTEGSFDEALQGCDAVCHVASAVLLDAKDPQREIVDVAVKGTENVLGSIQRCESVARLVLTSSIAAVVGGRRQRGHTYSEADWNRGATVKHSPYPLSKTLAEEAAWKISEVIARQRPFKMIALNPVVVLGPIYTRAHARSSPAFVRTFLLRKTPACPPLHFNLVDVRDVAAAHVEAIEREGAEGRYILRADGRWLVEIARTLATHYPDYPIPTRKLPGVVALLASPLIKQLRFHYLWHNLNRIDRVANRKSIEELGLSYRPVEQSILDTAQSMIDLGLAKSRA
jgi:nucleoside-diphosphate-sugar epimerase